MIRTLARSREVRALKWSRARAREGARASLGAKARDERDDDEADDGKRNKGKRESDGGGGDIHARAREFAERARAVANKAAEEMRARAKGDGGGGGATGTRPGYKEWLSPRALARAAIDAVREEMRLAMMDPGDVAKERRKRAGWSDAPPERYDGTTAVTTTAAPKPGVFGAIWSGVKAKLGVSKVIDTVEGLKKTAPYAKGAELAEDLRERWETSDSPMVHRIQDLQDSMFTETEQGEAYRIIRQRDPMFNMSDFMAEVKRDIPQILGAYLKGDVEALRKTSLSKEMLERLSGQMNLWKQEGQIIDPRILDLSDVELMEVRMMENEPLVVLTFSCQQINCVRDKTGKIVEGGQDDIQSVHYLWAMQLGDKKFTTEDGREYSKPTWELRELVLRGMMSVAA